MHPNIEKVLETAKTSQDCWDDLFATIRTGGLPLDRAYASLQGSTINELNERMAAVFLMLASLGNVEESGVTLLIPRIPNIVGPLTQILTQCQQALAQFKSYPDATFSDPGGNMNIHAIRGGSAVTNWAANSYFDVIAAQQMMLVDQLTLALRFGRYKGVGLFQERARELQGMSAQLAELVAKSKPLLAELEETLITAKETVKEGETELETSQEHRQQIVAMLPLAQKSGDEIDAKLARIKEITKASDALSTQIDSYSSSFEAFQSSLDTRVEAHEKFENDSSAASVANKAREKSIDDLISKADAMIRGATVAGLSTSLDETRIAYEARLSTTGWWFLGSVAILLFCLLPIAGQLIPGPWQEYFKPVPGANTDPWLATLGKIILLLPATWATAFFAGNYAELFHLSREYAHKAAMAKAVDGFKREAPEYKEEIVAGVFMEIRENPRGRKAPDAATPSNPLTARILEKILDGIKAKQPAKP